MASRGKVTRLADQVYGRPSGAVPLTLDLYRPADHRPRHPLLVFVHGGGWEAGDARSNVAFSDFPAQLQALAAQGYVVASVNYRLSGQAPYPAAVADIQAALAWLHAHAGPLAIDPQRTGLWGVSAGAHLAALAALTARPEQRVQALVAWYGAFDLETLAAFPPATADAARRWLGCTTGTCAQALAASPVSHLRGPLPPTLLLHGDQDAVIPMAQSQGMHQALRRAGGDSTLIVIPGVGHSFASPDLARRQAAIEQAMHASEAFWHRVLQPAG
ncbi:alpha/beta hydrolase [Pseudomonas silvicola]|nr:alpha/beta hydrolase [Pseudomonas silvicola]